MTASPLKPSPTNLGARLRYPIWRDSAPDFPVPHLGGRNAFIAIVLEVYYF